MNFVFSLQALRSKKKRNSPELFKKRLSALKLHLYYEETCVRYGDHVFSPWRLEKNDVENWVSFWSVCGRTHVYQWAIQHEHRIPILENSLSIIRKLSRSRGIATISPRSISSRLQVIYSDRKIRPICRRSSREFQLLFQIDTSVLQKFQLSHQLWLSFRKRYRSRIQHLSKNQRPAIQHKKRRRKQFDCMQWNNEKGR